MMDNGQRSCMTRLYISESDIYTFLRLCFTQVMTYEREVISEIGMDVRLDTE